MVGYLKRPLLPKLHGKNWGALFYQEGIIAPFFISEMHRSETRRSLKRGIGPTLGCRGAKYFVEIEGPASFSIL